MSLVCAVALPSVNHSTYFYIKSNESPNTNSNNENNNQIFTISNDQLVKTIELKPVFSSRKAFSLLWTHFKTSYSNRTIVQWSIWWTIAACGMFQV